MSIRTRSLASMKKVVAILGSLAVLALSQVGCGSAIEVWPHAAVNEEVSAAIESSGGSPSDWVFDNNCANMGNCSATLAAADAPEKVLATNVYVVKDSRAALTGTDNITALLLSR